MFEIMARSLNINQEERDILGDEIILHKHTYFIACINLALTLRKLWGYIKLMKCTQNQFRWKLCTKDNKIAQLLIYISFLPHRMDLIIRNMRRKFFPENLFIMNTVQNQCFDSKAYCDNKDASLWQKCTLYRTTTHPDSCIHSGAAQIRLYSRTRTSRHATRSTAVRKDYHDHSDLQTEE